MYDESRSHYYLGWTTANVIPRQCGPEYLDHIGWGTYLLHLPTNKYLFSDSDIFGSQIRLKVIFWLKKYPKSYILAQQIA